MVSQQDAHGVQRGPQPPGGDPVLLRGQGDAAGVVMGQHYGRGIGAQGHLHDPADGHGGGIYAAAVDHPAVQNFALGVQTEQADHFIAGHEKVRQQILPALGRGGEDAARALAVLHIPGHQLRQQPQER